jgi:hypothetical protein
MSKQEQDRAAELQSLGFKQVKKFVKGFLHADGNVIPTLNVPNKGETLTEYHFVTYSHKGDEEKVQFDLIVVGNFVWEQLAFPVEILVWVDTLEGEGVI